MRASIQHSIYKSSFDSWEEMCSKVARFAETIPREDLINISHSSEGGQGVIIVWYWGTAANS